MASHTKVVFPDPPPTINELTAHQRVQLVRKTRKIGQILGATPRFVDVGSESPKHISPPSTIPRRRLTKARRPSTDSGSNSSCRPFSLLIRRSTSLHRHSGSTGDPVSGQLYPSTSTRKPISSPEIWPINGRAAVLRLASTLSMLDPIPVSPSSTGTLFPISDLNSHSPPTSLHSRPISPQDDPTDRSSHSPPPFQPRSPNSPRKQKMDRIHKKMGHRVPISSHLAFPEDQDSEPPDYSPGSSLTSISPAHSPSPDLNEQYPLLPPPTPRPRKDPGRISSSRDSILGSVTIHRAKRQTYSGGQAHITTPGPDTEHRKSQSRPAPADLERGNERLASIAEGPEELNVTRVLKGGLKEDGSVKSEWFVAGDGETTVRLWSSRKRSDAWYGAGCEGATEQPTLGVHAGVVRGSVKQSPSYRKPVPAFKPVD